MVDKFDPKKFDKKNQDLLGGFDEIDIKPLTMDFRDRFNAILKYPRMDHVMNSYMERSNENDPSCVRVDMNQGRRIDFNADAQQEEVIYTFGLCGCIASALVLEMNDGSEKVIMTHNDPLTVSQGSNSISSLGSDIDPQNVKKAKTYILAPAEWKQNAEGKWEQSIKGDYEQYANLLEMSGGIVAGGEVEHERFGYSELQMADGVNQGTFRVVKEKDGKLKYIVGHYYPSGEVFQS